MRLLVALGVLALAAPALAQEGGDERAKAVYDRWCAGCHGVDGAGDGVGARTMLPPPRDFTRGDYQIRTTASGDLPTDEDILRIIDEGMPGTAMPGWKDRLSRDDREALVEYLKSFAPFFDADDPPEPVEIGDPPDVTEEGLAEGREFYEKIECFKCHGDAGRGDGSSAPTLEDDAGRPVRARDLTKNWLFDGGGSVEEIYTRLLTGLNGTPMPANADLLDADFMTRDQLWRVAQYVRSLSPEEPPTVREVVRAPRVETMPGGADDEAWDEIERFYVPLVAQIIEKPRWFEPMVNGVWVQAAHDGETVALRLVWHDPSESPDPDWLEWQVKVAQFLASDETDPVPGGATEGDAPVADSIAPSPAATELLPDAFAVQFPRTIPEGMERPYFLMGTEGDPVYLWRWESETGIMESLARGLARFEPLADAGEELDGEATYADGAWTLMLRRRLAAGEVDNRLAFEAGRAIPMALYAWDGSNGEGGAKGALSSWYFLWLDPPASSTTWIAPLVAMTLTGVLGLFVVAQAQRRRRENGAHESDDESPHHPTQEGGER